MCILAARLALHKGSTAGSWSGVAKSMCSVMLTGGSGEKIKINYQLSISYKCISKFC